jgi:hypothetical protein
MLAGFVCLAASQPGSAQDTTEAPAGVSSADPTSVALEKEKLLQEVEQLNHENSRWWVVGLSSLVGAIAPPVVALWVFFRYREDQRQARDQRSEDQKQRRADQQLARDQRAEERFQAVCEALGHDAVEARVGAAVTLRTFLRKGYEPYYRQVFDLAAVHLKALPGTVEDDPASRALRQALATVFVEAFPLARDECEKAPEEAPPDHEAIQEIQHRYEHLDGEDVQLAGAQLRRADFRFARLRRANFTGAHLREAHLDGANLSESKYSGANLDRASFEGADMRKALVGEAEGALGTNMRRVHSLSTDQWIALKKLGALLD